MGDLVAVPLLGRIGGPPGDEGAGLSGVAQDVPQRLDAAEAAGDRHAPPGRRIDRLEIGDAVDVGPDVHGVADFQAIDPASGRRVPITSRFRRVKALWNILSDSGKTSAFVAWWASYPAEKGDGYQVSHLLDPK